MTTVQTHGSDPAFGSFVKRTLVVMVLGGLAFALWRLAGLGVLVFAAILMAIGLRAATRALVGATGVGHAVGLSAVVAAALTAFGLAFWFFGSVIGGQLDELIRQVPAGLRLLSEAIQARPYARDALEQARGLEIPGMAGWAAGTLAALAGSLARGLGYAFVLFFVAIYIAAQPRLYRLLALRLVPAGYIFRAEELFNRSEDVLRRWLIGQLIVMSVIGILSGAGLWALGIDAALALGLVGGLLCFIPYIGAVLAAVPATLVALTQSPADALAVIAMYAGVHFAEGNFITPLVQAEATSLPPVLSLVSILALGTLIGPSAALVAAPLTLFLMVAIEVLYVEQALGRSALPSNAASGSLL